MGDGFVTESKSSIFRFEDIEVRENEYSFIRAGETVNVEPTAFRVLLYLLRNPGRLVTKDEIMAAVWQDTAVSDNSLTRSVATLRRLLDDSSREPRYIATVQSLGYRFLTPVDKNGIDSDPLGEGKTALVRPAPVSRRMIQVLVIGAAVMAVLAGLFRMRSRSAPPLEPKEVQITHNSSDNPITSVTVSPDGKYFAYSDVGGLHVKLIETAEIHNFPQPAELGQGRVHWQVSWLPDSTRFLAVPWGDGVPWSTWQASVLSGSMRLLLKGAVAWSVSPDGSEFAYTTEGENEMWVTGIGGDGPRKMAEAGPKNWFSFIEWSPDGSRLLYIKRVPVADHVQNLMEIQDIQGGGATTLLSDKTLNSVYWLRDGRILYVKGDANSTSDSCQIWVARLDDAFQRFSAQPQPLTHDKGFCFSSMSATADGKRLYFLRRISQSGIYVADLAEGATRISPPRHLSTTDDPAFPAAWTLDSRDVVFVSTREHKWGLYRQSPGSETATPILTDMPGEAFPRVSPDGAWLVYAPFPPGYADGATIDLFRVPINGGAPRRIMKAPVYDTPRCSRTTATPCATATKDKDLLTFTAFDPVQGGGRELGRFRVDEPEKFYTWDLSPDGTRIAILKRGGSEIHLLDLHTQEDRKIVVNGWSGLTTLDWTPDGKGLFTSSSSSGSVLLKIDLEGHAHVLWEPRGDAMVWSVSSPDGQHVAMPGFSFSSNVWSMRDF